MNRRLILSLAISCLIGVLPALAQEVPATRILVMIPGTSISSTEVLYQYADLLDLGGIEGMAKDSPSQIIPFQDLIEQLPQPLQGWTADDPQGMVLNTGTFSYSFASREYHRNGGEEELSLVIYDTVGEQMGPWFAFWYGTGFYYENQEGYLRSITYKGYYGVEQMDHTDNAGNLIIGLTKESAIPEVANLLGVLALMAFYGIYRRRIATRAS